MPPRDNYLATRVPMIEYLQLLTPAQLRYMPRVRTMPITFRTRLEHHLHAGNLGRDNELTYERMPSIRGHITADGQNVNVMPHPIRINPGSLPHEQPEDTKEVFRYIYKFATMTREFGPFPAINNSYFESNYRNYNAQQERQASRWISDVVRQDISNRLRNDRYGPTLHDLAYPYTIYEALSKPCKCESGSHCRHTNTDIYTQEEGRAPAPAVRNRIERNRHRNSLLHRRKICVYCAGTFNLDNKKLYKIPLTRSTYELMCETCLESFSEPCSFCNAKVTRSSEATWILHEERVPPAEMDRRRDTSLVYRNHTGSIGRSVLREAIDTKFLLACKPCAHMYYIATTLATAQICTNCKCMMKGEEVPPIGAGVRHYRSSAVNPAGEQTTEHSPSSLLCSRCLEMTTVTCGTAVPATLDDAFDDLITESYQDENPPCEALAYQTRYDVARQRVIREGINTDHAAIILRIWLNWPSIRAGETILWHADMNVLAPATRRCRACSPSTSGFRVTTHWFNDSAIPRTPLTPNEQRQVGCRTQVDHARRMRTRNEGGQYRNTISPEALELETSRLMNYTYKPPAVIIGDTAPNRLYMGIELETELRPGVSKEAAWLAFVAHSTIPGLFYAKPDGSLSSGIEIVSRPCSPKWFLDNMETEAFTALLPYARDQHANAGTHIHLSKEAVTPTHLWKLLRMHTTKPVRQHLAVLGGRHYPFSLGIRSNATKQEELAARKLIARKLDINHLRTVAINLMPSYTIEFRYPEPGIHPNIIKKNVQLIHALFLYTQQVTRKDVENKLLDSVDDFYKWTIKNVPNYTQLLERFDDNKKVLELKEMA